MGELLSQSSTLNKTVERIEAKAMKLPTWEELKRIEKLYLTFVRDRHVYRYITRRGLNRSGDHWIQRSQAIQ